jgi:hypothetical protein
MSRLICIEEFCGRQKLAQTFHKRAFTRGNSTGDSDRRHKKLSAVQAAVSPAKFQKQSRHAPKRGADRLVAAIDPFDFAQRHLL